MPAIAAAAIGAAGSIGGGLIGSKSSKNAAKQAANGKLAGYQMINAASNTALTNENQTLLPYETAGQQGVEQFAKAVAPGGDLTKQFSFDPSKIADNPNYQFVLAQGTKAVQQSAAAQGGLFSGGTMKALDQYSQGLATQTVNDAYAQAANTFQMNRNNQFQNLTALTSVGQTAASQQGNEFGQYLQSQEAAADTYAGIGAAQANGTLSAGNAWQNALQGLTAYAQQATYPQSKYSAPVARDSQLPAGTVAPPPEYPTYIPPPPNVRTAPTGGFYGSTGVTYQPGAQTFSPEQVQQMSQYGYTGGF